MENERPELRWIGVVLAGGTSRRMGEDKASLPHPDRGGRSWLDHSLSQLVPLVDELWVVGRTSGPNDRPPSAVPLFWAGDDEPDSGPVGGLVTATRVAGDRALLAVACDMPALTTGVLQKLKYAVLGSGDRPFVEGSQPSPRGAVFVDDQGRICGPAVALRPDAYPLLADAFSRGQRKLQSVIEACAVTSLSPTLLEEEALQNLNSPSDREFFARKRDAKE